MNKGVMVVVLVVLLAVAGVVLYRHLNKPAPQPTLEVKTVEAPAETTCVHCKKAFKLAEAEPVAGNQSLVVCPHCRKKTPRVNPRDTKGPRR